MWSPYYQTCMGVRQGLSERGRWAEICLTSSEHLYYKRPQDSHDRTVSVMEVEGGKNETVKLPSKSNIPNFPLFYHLRPAQSSSVSLHFV